MPIYTCLTLNGHGKTSEAGFSDGRSCAALCRIGPGFLTTAIEADEEKIQGGDPSGRSIKVSSSLKSSILRGPKNTMALFSSILTFSYENGIKTQSYRLLATRIEVGRG